MLCRPIEHGAAVVVHSTTKYIGGHGTSIGGIVVDGGNFDWEKHAARFPLLNQPDPSYHGAVWTQAAKPLGPIAYILKMRVTLLRDLGAPMSPFNAFMFIQGLETLPLRMRAHCANAMAVTRFLAEHPKVTRVIHPSMMTGEAKRRADAYLKGGYGGLVGFELQGGTRGRASLYRRAADVLPRRQYRRRAQLWRSIRRRRPTRSSRRKSNCRPGSTKITSGCRSASSTKRTSSPISGKRSTPPEPRLRGGGAR